MRTRDDHSFWYITIKDQESIRVENEASLINVFKDMMNVREGSFEVKYMYKAQTEHCQGLGFYWFRDKKLRIRYEQSRPESISDLWKKAGGSI